MLSLNEYLHAALCAAVRQALKPFMHDYAIAVVLDNFVTESAENVCNGGPVPYIPVDPAIGFLQWLVVNTPAVSGCMYTVTQCGATLLLDGEPLFAIDNEELQNVVQSATANYSPHAVKH